VSGAVDDELEIWNAARKKGVKHVEDEGCAVHLDDSDAEHRECGDQTGQNQERGEHSSRRHTHASGWQGPIPLQGMQAVGLEIAKIVEGVDTRVKEHVERNIELQQRNEERPVDFAGED
jgi:hypothetical protein